VAWHEEGDYVKKEGSNIIVQLLIVSGVAMMIFYLFVFRGTTHQEDFAACTASCHEKKLSGKILCFARLIDWLNLSYKSLAIQNRI
jgi:hypothetical protein